MTNETTVTDIEGPEAGSPDSDDEIELDPERELNFVLQKRKGEL